MLMMSKKMYISRRPPVHNLHDTATIKLIMFRIVLLKIKLVRTGKGDILCIIILPYPRSAIVIDLPGLVQPPHIMDSYPHTVLRTARNCKASCHMEGCWHEKYDPGFSMCFFFFDVLRGSKDSPQWVEDKKMHKDGGGMGVRVIYMSKNKAGYK